MYKLTIIMRNDLKLPKGKMSAQSAHAAVEATLITQKKDKDLIQKWRQQGQKKIVLKVNSEKELYKLKQIAKDYGITTALITDAGKTVVEPGTVTCLGLGPDSEEKIDQITKELQMM